MYDDPRTLPVHQGSVFDREAFDACTAAYPLGWSLPVPLSPLG